MDVEDTADATLQSGRIPRIISSGTTTARTGIPVADNTRNQHIEMQ